MPHKHKTPIPEDEISTRTVIKEAMSQLKNNKDYAPTPCGRPDCKYESDKENRENWLDSRFLKTAGVIIGVLSPLFVWIIVSIFEIKEQTAVKSEKLIVIEKKIDEILISNKEQKEAFDQLRLQLARDGRLSWLPQDKGTNP